MVREKLTRQPSRGPECPSVTQLLSPQPGCTHRRCGGLQLRLAPAPLTSLFTLALRPLANIVPGGEAPGRAGTPPSSPEPDLHPATAQLGPQEPPPTHGRPGKGQRLLVSQLLAAITATGAVQGFHRVPQWGGEEQESHTGSDNTHLYYPSSCCARWAQLIHILAF